MTSDIQELSTAFKEYLSALKKLKEAKVLLNKKDFTGQLGEWLVAELYNGARATSSKQPGWDVLTAEGKIQVKTHATAFTNKSRWSPVTLIPTEPFDFLVIVVFSEEYKLKELYKIPREVVEDKKVTRTAQKKDELNWSSVTDYRVPHSALRPDIIRMFT